MAKLVSFIDIFLLTNLVRIQADRHSYAITWAYTNKYFINNMTIQF